MYIHFWFLCDPCLCFCCSHLNLQAFHTRPPPCRVIVKAGHAPMVPPALASLVRTAREGPATCRIGSPARDALSVALQPSTGSSKHPGAKELCCSNWRSGGRTRVQATKPRSAVAPWAALWTTLRRQIFDAALENSRNSISSTAGCTRSGPVYTPFCVENLFCPNPA